MAEKLKKRLKHTETRAFAAWIDPVGVNNYEKSDFDALGSWK
jgi:hypothetical protein